MPTSIICPVGMTGNDVRAINRLLRNRYAGARGIRYHTTDFTTPATCEVSCYVDRMPGTDKPGRIFAGFARELRREALSGE